MAIGDIPYLQIPAVFVVTVEIMEHRISHGISCKLDVICHIPTKTWYLVFNELLNSELFSSTHTWHIENYLESKNYITVVLLITDILYVCIFYAIFSRISVFFQSCLLADTAIYISPSLPKNCIILTEKGNIFLKQRIHWKHGRYSWKELYSLFLAL